MPLQSSIYLVPLLVAGGISTVLAVLAVRKRRERTVPQMIGILVGASIWSFADAARLASVDLGPKLLFHDLRFVGSTLIVYATILFALEYTNRERWLARRYLVALAVPFVLTLLLVATDGFLDHGLIRSGVEVVTTEGLRLADIDFGPWFYVNAVYSYLLLFVTMGVYVVEILRGRAGTYRRQTIAFAVSLLIPWILNGLYLAEVTLVDLTAVGLTVTGVAYYVAIFWLNLLELVPIARSTLVDHIEHGVLVHDPDGLIVDVNESMVSLLGVSRSTLLGTRLSRVETDVPEIATLVAEGRETDDLTITDGAEERHFEVEATHVYSDLDRHLGRLVLVRDVTELREREAALRERTAQLERQNEQLERFANVVSHDLRNPINTATGYLDLARETGDLSHLEKADQALDRMAEIVGDVLALARHSVDEEAIEPVGLATVAEAAWDTVETGEASLSVRTDRDIAADPGKLQQLLENLFRNATDHGPADVTVTVGDTTDGFYVADDGPGIPDADREKVFDYGYSTDEDGTGFGLSIVKTIAEAHGWTVRATAAESGGARFETTGVKRASGDGVHSSVTVGEKD